MSKETYSYGKTDLFLLQPDLFIWQKRPTNVLAYLRSAQEKDRTRRDRSASRSTQKHSAAARVLPSACKCFRKHFAAARVFPEARGGTLPAPECLRKHLQALCRQPSTSGELGRTLPASECFRKHSEALCRRSSASGSTRKHVHGKGWVLRH